MLGIEEWSSREAHRISCEKHPGVSAAMQSVYCIKLKRVELKVIFSSMTRVICTYLASGRPSCCHYTTCITITAIVTLDTYLHRTPLLPSTDSLS
jgi:hypothetical protein